ILLIFSSYLCDFKKHKQYARLLYFILFILFYVVSALRYHIGGDTLMYISFHKYYPDFFDFTWAKDVNWFNTNVRANYQPGWILYAMLVRSLNPDFMFMQIVSAFIVNCGIFYAIRKYSPYPFTTLLIYFLTFTFIMFEFEVLREAVGVGFFLLIAFDGWMQKKWVRYYIGAFIAYMFHSSAILMFALPFIRYINWKNRTYLLFFILPALILGFAGRIFLGDIISNLLDAQSSMQFYNNRAIDSAYNTNYIFTTLYQPFMLLAFMILWRKYVNPTLVPIVFATITIQIFALFDFDCARLANYIMIPTYIAITSILFKLAKRAKTIWVVVLFMLVYYVPNAYVVWSGGEKSWSRYIPYQTAIYPNQTEAQKRYWK
ncbi:MAG: EpsG family protein, partial [Muribaculaceae bacterium]|nr:EpsG family protein [Muribaculaceae bacterium]